MYHLYSEETVDKLISQLKDQETQLAQQAELLREMGKTMDRFMSFGNIYRVRDWETSPYKQAEEILNRPNVKALMEEE